MHVFGSTNRLGIVNMICMWEITSHEFEVTMKVDEVITTVHYMDFSKVFKMVLHDRMHWKVRLHEIDKW